MKHEPHRLVFFAFDLLHLDGEDLRGRPLLERKARLAELLSPPDPLCPIQLSEHYEGSGALLLRAAERAGVEGIISKRVDSRYVSGPSKAWLKTKCWTSGEFVVIGTEPGDGGPPLALLARDEHSGLVYAGTAFITLNEPERDLFWSRTAELACEKVLAHLRNKKASWCRPELRVQVRYLRGGGMLRHAIVAGVVSTW
jgi:ATP-dependent DNA ligase